MNRKTNVAVPEVSQKCAFWFEFAGMSWCNSGSLKCKFYSGAGSFMLRTPECPRGWDEMNGSWHLPL